MPCNNSACKKTVQKDGVRYCVCGACCCCHCYKGFAGGICPDGKHWWNKLKLNKTIYRKKWLPTQSHGGHGWTPCNNGAKH